MNTTITPLKAWLRAASTDEKARLAAAVGTSVMYLRHLAATEDKRYRRQPSADLAAGIERETTAMHRETVGRLPVVYRTDLNATCRECAFARKCLGEEIATRGEFPIIVGAGV